MQIVISSQFSDDFKRFNDALLYQKVKNVIEDFKKNQSLRCMPYFRNIQGDRSAFKMAIGFYFLIAYRTGITEYTLMRCLSRDEVLNFQLK